MSDETQLLRFYEFVRAWIVAGGNVTPYQCIRMGFYQSPQVYLSLNARDFLPTLLYDEQLLYRSMGGT